MPATPKRKPLPKRRRPSSPGGDRATGEVAGPQPNDEEHSGKESIQSKDITGLKYFDMLLPLLQPLHDDQCQRDKANNRDLHFDQYCMLVLLYLFNPTVTSLRAIQQASELEKVQKKLDCSRASLGSLSEASRLFDPERLKAVIAELGEQANAIGRHKDIREIA